jgi:hypothetical protein
VISITGKRATGHRYDINGLVSINSAVALPELQFFKTRRVVRPDLVIEIGSVGGVSPRARCTMVEDSRGITYREHLGSALGANFRIDTHGDVIKVIASPLLALSRHVLYTNIIEVLLRLMLANRDHMLLHAACVEFDGRGIMLSAQTDTGKTSTILRMLGERRGTFLSDDMTIISADGVARSYPKPLTISAHTVRALDIRRLRPAQRAALSIQSRLHSRTGRSIGQQMAEANIPIMGINAMVQATIPPPKYMVTDLVDCVIGEQTSMDSLYIIERGIAAPPSPVSHAEAVTQLVANTEDAYGFPPYAELAPRLVVGGSTYDELREHEVGILSSALQRTRVTRLRTDDYGWAAHIYSDLDAVAGQPRLLADLQAV